MIKKIFETIFSKGIIAVINFLIFMLTAKYTGAEGRGEISMMYLNISIIIMISDLVGGSALVYLIPKIGVRKIIMPAFISAIIIGIILPFIFNLLLQDSSSNLLWLIILSVIMNLSSTGNNILTGLNKIRLNNIIHVGRIIMILGILCIYIFYKKQNIPESYYLSLLMGYLTFFCFQLIVLYNYIFPFMKEFSLDIIKEILSYGWVVQAGNVIQLLNYRLTYYLIDYLFPLKGNAMIGVFSTGSSIIESSWIIINGIAVVQYAAISNNNPSDPKNISISLFLSKASFLLTVLTVFVILIVPNSLYIYFFGAEFSDIKTIIYLLSPGIIIMGFTGVYSHYFSGTGQMIVSTKASLAGLTISILIGLLLIPYHGIAGAAITSTCSYLTSSFFLAKAFRKQTGCSIREQLFDYKNVFNLKMIRKF